MRLTFPSGAPNGTEILLNQNSHPLWGFAGGIATRDRRGNLRAVLTRGAAPGARLDLTFHDPASALGERVSFWSALAAAVAALALSLFAFARRLSRRREALRASDSGGGSVAVAETSGLLR
jgi:hypothetical protein